MTCCCCVFFPSGPFACVFVSEARHCPLQARGLGHSPNARGRCVGAGSRGGAPPNEDQIRLFPIQSQYDQPLMAMAGHCQPCQSMDGQGQPWLTMSMATAKAKAMSQKIHTKKTKGGTPTLQSRLGKAELPLESLHQSTPVKTH